MAFTPPPRDCPLCPRLAAFRAQNRVKFPDKWNAPVPSFGPENAALIVVGLAPGLKGANFSGRPFTGDYAGVLLYSSLLKFGFAEGTYEARADDGLRLINCRITNAVRCVPPENKPLPEEEKTCRTFLQNEFSVLKNAKVILSLGLVSHNAVLKTFGKKAKDFKFAHGAVHDLGPIKLVDSYHCSRYNTQTKRLTEAMFHDVFRKIKSLL
jgi:uracil-DNA glycosylase family 4